MYGITLRSKPTARDDEAAVPTTGTAIPLTVSIRQVKIYVSGRAYIGIGLDDSPPTASETNSTHQEASTEIVYVLDGHAAYGTHVYVYAAAGTIICRISFYS